MGKLPVLFSFFKPCLLSGPLFVIFVNTSLTAFNLFENKPYIFFSVLEIN